MGLKKYPKTLNDLTGYIAYEPEGYDKSKKYPVIVFFHGIGERGDGSESSLQPLYDFINSQWNNFTGTWGLGSNKWIFIAPQLQLVHGNWQPSYVSDALRFARNYSIDEERKVLMCVSLGGQLGWLAPSMGTEFCAALNICPVYVQVNFCNIKIPVWAFHAKGDPVVGYGGTKSAIDAINVCQPPTRAKYTELNKNYHEIWGEVLQPVLFPGETLTAWQWMEQQKRGSTVQPTPPIFIPPTEPTLKADTSATLTSVMGTTALLDGTKSTGYNPNIWNGAEWAYISGPDWDIFPNNSKMGITKQIYVKKPGTYVVELTVRDGKGGSDKERVTLNVVGGKQQVGTGTANGQPAVLYSDNTWK